MREKEKKELFFYHSLYKNGVKTEKREFSHKNFLLWCALFECECALMKITSQFDYAVVDGAMGKMLRFLCSHEKNMIAPALAFKQIFRFSPSESTHIFHFQQQHSYALISFTLRHKENLRKIFSLNMIFSIGCTFFFFRGKKRREEMKEKHF